MVKLKIKKANRILTIDKYDLDKRLEEGYDQIDEQGEVIKLATGGRTVSLPEHNKVLEELQSLKEKQGDAEDLETVLAENEKLKKENTVLKGKLTKAENTLEAATKETKK